MKIDQNNIVRLRDLNPTQRDILKIVFKHMSQCTEWTDFDKVIFYKGHRFRVELTYKLDQFFLSFKKFESREEEGVIIKPKYINRKRQ